MKKLLILSALTLAFVGCQTERPKSYGYDSYNRVNVSGTGTDGVHFRSDDKLSAGARREVEELKTIMTDAERREINEAAGAGADRK